MSRPGPFFPTNPALRALTPRRAYFATVVALVATLVAVASAFDALAIEPALPDSAASLSAVADRCLRAAESRDDDETTRALYRQAAELAQQALDEDPNSAQANFVLFAARGRILLAQGPLASLLKLHSVDGYLERALELDPKYAHALAAKGGLLLDLPFYLGGDPEQAEHILRRAVELNPTGPGTRLGLARALLRNGDPAGARQQLMRAGHYACLERRAKTLDQVRELLATIDAAHAEAEFR